MLLAMAAPDHCGAWLLLYFAAVVLGSFSAWTLWCLATVVLGRKRGTAAGHQGLYFVRVFGRRLEEAVTV